MIDDGIYSLSFPQKVDRCRYDQHQNGPSIDSMQQTGPKHVFANEALRMPGPEELRCSLPHLMRSSNHLSFIRSRSSGTRTTSRSYLEGHRNLGRLNKRLRCPDTVPPDRDAGEQDHTSVLRTMPNGWGCGTFQATKFSMLLFDATGGQYVVAPACFHTF
jgi:hypothetical protein